MGTQFLVRNFKLKCLNAHKVIRLLNVSQAKSLTCSSRLSMLYKPILSVGYAQKKDTVKCVIKEGFANSVTF